MKNKVTKEAIMYKIVLCIIILLSIVATTGILDGDVDMNIFEMFTTISNIACLLYFIIDIIYISKNKNKSVWCPFLKGMVTVSIMLTLLVAESLLKMNITFGSFKEASFLGLHIIVPIMTLLDWLIFDKKGLIKKYYPFIWIVLPGSYFIASMIAAKYGDGLGINTRYPYPFMDIDANGITKVMLTSIIILISYIIMGYILYFFDNALKKRKRTK